VLAEEAQVPSTNELAAFYRINPATAAKGINKLVEEGLWNKKRGIGMFVALGAPERLRQKRRQKFNDLYVQPLAAEAGKLGIGVDELLDMIKPAHLSDSSHGGMRDV